MALRINRIFGQAVGGPDMVVEEVTIEVETRQKRKEAITGEVLVLRVRPKAAHAGRCSRCRAVCPGYDGGGGVRRWRTLDVGTMRAYLEAPRRGSAATSMVSWSRTCRGRGRELSGRFSKFFGG